MVVIYMGLVGKICMLPLLGEIKKLKSRLYNNPELAGRQIFEFIIATQHPEAIEYITTLLDDYHKISEKNSSSYYSKLVSSIDDVGGID
jgi:hypothetical protein